MNQWRTSQTLRQASCPVVSNVSKTCDAVTTTHFECIRHYESEFQQIFRARNVYKSAAHCSAAITDAMIAGEHKDYCSCDLSRGLCRVMRTDDVAAIASSKLLYSRRNQWLRLNTITSNTKPASVHDSQVDALRSELCINDNKRDRYWVSQCHSFPYRVLIFEGHFLRLYRRYRQKFNWDSV